MADAIFISYRRDDSEGEAGRLFDDLTRAFGNDAVFMDVAGIKPGADFRKAIDDNVTSCGVFLAIVGPTWATIANSEGTRRLDDPNDFVALELGSALKREVPVIPVLVHDAKMPPVSLLPENLKAFAYRNSVELSHARWNSDVALLIEALKGYVTPKPGIEAPIHATVPVQLPAPHHPAGDIVPAVQKNWKPALIGGLCGALLIIALVLYFALKPDPAAQFVGTWKLAGGPAGAGDMLGELIISDSASGLTVHAFGSCQAPACDWGQQAGDISGGKLVATFTPPPSGSDTSRTAMVTAQRTQGGLDVAIHNTFQSPAGSRTAEGHRLLSPVQ